MKFVLKRKVNMKKFVVIAETARFKERDDIISVLKLANEKGGKVSPKQICDELLGGKPIIVGERIVHRCSELELLDGDGLLTQRGLNALSENKIPEPERAIYSVWYADDSIIPDNEKLLRIEQSRQSSRDELFGDNIESNKKLIELPTTLVNTPEKFQNLQLRGEKAIILKIEVKGKEVKIPFRENVFVEWEVSQSKPSRINLKEYIEKKVSPPEVTFQTVFISLLGSEIQNWNDVKSSFKANFDLLSDKELITFNQTKEFTNPEIVNFGKFNTLKLVLDIYPSTLENANLWANWLLKNTITSYMSQKKYSEYQTNIKMKFPDYEIELVPQEQLITEFRREKETDPKICKNYWFLQTPLDLIIDGD